MLENQVMDASQPIADNSVPSTDTATDTSIPPSFIETLSEDLRSEAGLKSFKDVNSLAKSYVEAQKYIGSSLRIPSQDASTEARNEFFNKLSSVPGVVKIPDESNTEELNQFYNKLGRPETPDSYQFKVPETQEIDQEAITAFKETAHKFGITNKQAQALLELQLSLEGQVASAQEAKLTNFDNKLKEMWGNAYDTRLEGAKAVAGRLQEQFPDEMQDLAQVAGRNPALLHILSEYNKFMQESGAVPVAARINYDPTPTEAKSKIKEIYANKEHPYFIANHPDHNKAIEYVNSLFNLANSAG